MVWDSFLEVSDLNGYNSIQHVKCFGNLEDFQAVKVFFLLQEALNTYLYFVLNYRFECRKIWVLCKNLLPSKFLNYLNLGNMLLNLTLQSEH